jgi:hypothetical protein
MKNLLLFLSVAGVVLFSGNALAFVFELTPFPDDPQATEIRLTGRNNAGMVAGILVDEQGLISGFRYDLHSGTYLDPYPVNYPTPLSNTQVFGINDSGDYVGNYYNDDFISHGFGCLNGSFRQIDAITDGQTLPMGINNNDVFVGFVDGRHVNDWWGFVYDLDTGSVINGYFDNMIFRDINDSEKIVGHNWTNSFIYDFTAGTYMESDILFPGSTMTQGLGINNSNEIVGIYYEDDGDMQGFFYDGVFTTIDYPDAPTSEIWILGINDSRQISGWYRDARDGSVHGFIGAPVPLPGAIWLLGSGLAGLWGWRMRNSKIFSQNQMLS